MKNKKLKSLDLSVLDTKKSTRISSKDALKDVTPIGWSEDVLLCKKKIIVDKGNY